MTSMTIDDAEPVPVALARNTRQTLGTAVDAPTRIDDRLSLGKPVCVALDATTVDAAALDFLRGRPQSQFWLVALTCSFRADPDAPLTSAWIELALSVVAPPGAETTAWSMEPLVAQDPVKTSTVVKLDASLKLTSDVVPVEVGPSAGRETTTEITRQSPYLEAYREGTDRPVWYFRRTEVTEIRGVHRLRTVVELPAGATVEGRVGAGAEVRLKLLGVIPYRTPLADVPAHRTVSIGDTRDHGST